MLKNDIDNFIQNIKDKKITKFWVKVKTAAKNNAIDGFIVINDKDYLSISVTAIRDQGRANKMILEYLAKTFAIPQKNIYIKTGLTAPIKQIAIM
jgi:uncharacterized protein YggU (UPF0235/DUF167 family)